MADRFVSLTGSVDRAFLEQAGIKYSTFSTYLTGRTEMPGWVQARLLETVSWDWAWGLSANEKVILAEAILRDRDTSLSGRLRGMSLYFGMLREVHDFDGHERLVKDLRKQFPSEQFPMEEAAIIHDECLIQDARGNNPSLPREAEHKRIKQWQAARNALITAETAGFFDPDVRVAIIRDFAASLARLVPARELPGRDLLDLLHQARNDLISCEGLAPNRIARGYHFYAEVQVEATIGDFRRAHIALEKLRQLCELDSSSVEGRSELWLRYDLALAYILERTDGVESAKEHLLKACDRLRYIGCATWEARLIRQLM